MLAWAGFIGKLVELILTKIIDKRLDLRLDERKKAAKAFLGLHDALVQLGSVVEEFLAAVEPVLSGKQPRLYRAPLASIARLADAASRSFGDSLHELHQIIRIYDSNLAALLSGVAHVKQGILTTSAGSKMEFTLLPNPESVFVIGYSAPSERLMAANLEDSYDVARDIAARLNARAGGVWLEWPKDVLLSLVEDNLTEGRISDNDVAHIKEFYEMVAKYAPFLAKAREQLEAFIRKSFSIEDLLYVQLQGRSRLVSQDVSNQASHVKRRRSTVKRLLVVLVGVALALGFAGFILVLVDEVMTGKEADIYTSMKGLRTSPITVLVVLALIPVVLLVGSIWIWWEKRTERSLQK